MKQKKSWIRLGYGLLTTGQVSRYVYYMDKCGNYHRVRGDSNGTTKF